MSNEDGTLSAKIGGNIWWTTLEKVYHQTVKKVTEDFEGMRNNTAISQMMVFINDGYKADSIPKEYVEGFVKMISPVSTASWQKSFGKNLVITIQLRMKHGQHLMNQNCR